MSEIELKPCPFCGGTAKLHHPKNIGADGGIMSDMGMVQCETLGCFGSIPQWSSTSRAIAAWNRRAETRQASFQDRVAPWMRECFGPTISADRVERGDRFLEEAFELLQSGGYDRSRINALIGYVWSRPVGEPAQEVGGVMVTLAAYCLAHGLDMHDAGETELARILQPEIVQKIRAKQAAKARDIPFSPLPAATPARQEPTDYSNLLSVITDIRERSGVGSKPMLSELADAIAERIAEPKVGDEVVFCPQCGWNSAMDAGSPRPAAEDEENASGERETCNRCAGNGELVTDWDRYLHGPLDENGDDAVRECPDCNGTGHVEPLPAGPVTDEMVDRATAKVNLTRISSRKVSRGEMRAALEAAFAARPAEPVAVKELRWEQPDGYGETHSWLGHGTDYCQYYIRWDSNGAWVMPGDADEPDAYATIDEAKAAAQADYDRRILSALATPPVPDSVVEALREISSTANGRDTFDAAPRSVSEKQRRLSKIFGIAETILASITETGGVK